MTIYTILNYIFQTVVAQSKYRIIKPTPIHTMSRCNLIFEKIKNKKIDKKSGYQNRLQPKIQIPNNTPPEKITKIVGKYE